MTEIPNLPPIACVQLDWFASVFDLFCCFRIDLIFTLAHHENPEAFLFLEAVSDPISPDYWRYAWAKGTSSPVTVELDGSELLHIPGSLNDTGSASKPFWVFFRSNAASAAEGEEEEASQPF